MPTSHVLNARSFQGQLKHHTMVSPLACGVAKTASSPFSRSVSRPFLSVPSLPSTREPGCVVAGSLSFSLQSRTRRRSSFAVPCPARVLPPALTGSSQSTVAPIQLCLQSPRDSAAAPFREFGPGSCGQYALYPKRGPFCHTSPRLEVSGMGTATSAFSGVHGTPGASASIRDGSSRSVRAGWLVLFRSLYSSPASCVPSVKRSASDHQSSATIDNGFSQVSSDAPRGSSRFFMRAPSTGGEDSFPPHSRGDTTASSLFPSFLCYLFFLTAATAKFFTLTGDRRRRAISCEEDKSKPDALSKASSSPTPQLVSRRLFGSWFPLVCLPEPSKEQISSSVVSPRQPTQPGEEETSSAPSSLLSLPDVTSSPSGVSTPSGSRGGGGTEGRGGLMRWSGGGIGRWSEAANAPIEDRSFAVFLSLQNDGSSSAIQEEERACTGFASHEESTVTTADLERAAALVFRDEIAAVLGRQVESPSFPAYRRKLMKERHAKTDSKAKKQKILLAAVIDGHGGPQVGEVHGMTASGSSSLGTRFHRTRRTCSPSSLACLAFVLVAELCKRWRSLLAKRISAVVTCEVTCGGMEITVR